MLSTANRFTIIVIAVLMFQIIGLPNAIAASEKEIESLIKQLEDRNGDMRISAANRLGQIGSAAEAAVPALAKALNDLYVPARQAAAQALKKIGTPEALKVVQQFKETQVVKPTIPNAGRNLRTAARLRYVGLGLGLASSVVSRGDNNSDTEIIVSLSLLLGSAAVDLVAVPGGRPPR